jgi:hypothetical protein
VRKAVWTDGGYCTWLGLWRWSALVLVVYDVLRWKADAEGALVVATLMRGGNAAFVVFVNIGSIAVVELKL